MAAQLSPDALSELDRAQGGPVQFEDPRTRAKYVLIPQEAYRRVQPFIEPAAKSNGEDAVEWNEAKNTRRGELIDRKYAAGLSPAEEAELNGLQEEMYRYRAQVAPLPLRALELMREALEHRAAKQRSSSA
jgi:hypothetical protein